MRPKEIVERIMTKHWDMAACKCWVCREGRKAGCHPIDQYLPRKSKKQFGRIKVEQSREAEDGN